MILQQAAFNKLQRTRDNMIATLPRIIAWSEFRPTTQTRAKTGCFGRGGGGEKTDVFRFRRRCRANGAAIDASAANGDEEQAVKACIAAQTGPFARLLIEHGGGGCLGHVLRLAPPTPQNSPFSDIDAHADFGVVSGYLGRLPIMLHSTPSRRINP
jgi:hypothetical protein